MTTSAIGSVAPPSERGDMSVEEVLALPLAISVATAARAFKIGADKAYRLIEEGRFPAKLIPLGDTTKVATASVWEALGLR